ncbi:MAG TPA: hypothetical protein PKY26_05555 [Acetivibrio clariflavus]|nr:hypothetical protein [Acetivibrio clariflavus]
MVRFVLRNYNDGYITLEKIITINNRVYKFPYRTTRKIGEICLVLIEVNRLRKRLLAKGKTPDYGVIVSRAANKVAKDLDVCPSIIYDKWCRKLDKNRSTSEIVKLISDYFTGKDSSLQGENLYDVLIKSVKGKRNEKIDTIVIKKLFECMDLID